MHYLFLVWLALFPFLPQIIADDTLEPGKHEKLRVREITPSSLFTTVTVQKVKSVTLPIGAPEVFTGQTALERASALAPKTEGPVSSFRLYPTGNATHDRFVNRLLELSVLRHFPVDLALSEEGQITEILVAVPGYQRNAIVFDYFAISTLLVADKTFLCAIEKHLNKAPKYYLSPKPWIAPKPRTYAITSAPIEAIAYVQGSKEKHYVFLAPESQSPSRVLNSSDLIDQIQTQQPIGVKTSEREEALEQVPEDPDCPDYLRPDAIAGNGPVGGRPTNRDPGRP